MAACSAFPRQECAVSSSRRQCKAGKRRCRNRCALHHARQRALSNAFQVISGRYEFNQQEGRARALVHPRKTRSKAERFWRWPFIIVEKLVCEAIQGDILTYEE